MQVSLHSLTKLLTFLAERLNIRISLEAKFEEARIAHLVTKIGENFAISTSVVLSLLKVLH